MLLALLLSALTAAAAPHAEPAGARNIVAVRGLACASWAHVSSGPLVGGGVLFEHALGRHLGAEVAVSYLSGQDLAEVPVEVLAKRPIHLGPAVELDPGLGGLVSVPAHGEAALVPGVIANADAFFWGQGGVGLLLEVDGIVLLDEGGLAPQVEVGAGLAAHF